MMLKFVLYIMFLIDEKNISTKFGSRKERQGNFAIPKTLCGILVDMGKCSNRVAFWQFSISLYVS